jgi:hypothetical protein
MPLTPPTLQHYFRIAPPQRQMHRSIRRMCVADFAPASPSCWSSGEQCRGVFFEARGAYD